MSSAEENFQALAFIALDGLSFFVPASKIPAALLKEIILNLEEDDIIHFVPSEAQLEQIRSQAAGVAAAKGSAVTSFRAHEHDRDKK